MNHLGDTNKMVSDTPRTDAAYFKKGATMYDLAGEMKLLERELNAANERIKRLEEAGHELLYDNDNMENINRWRKAKEAKL